MRLIDADEINYVGNHVGDEYEDRFHDAQWVYRDSIDRTPTIEAIPVEWLEKWLDGFLGVKLEEEITDLDPFKKNVYQGIFLMYNDWRRDDGK